MALVHKLVRLWRSLFRKSRLDAELAGLAIGMGGAVFIAQLLQSRLFGVTAMDVPTYITAVAVISCAGLLASWLPARKAAVFSALEVMKAE